MDYVALGENIKRFRKIAGLTQAKLAEKAGYCISFIGQLETADTKPSLETLVNIAQALSVTVDQLLIADTDYPERIYMKEITERLETYSVSHRILLCEMIKNLLDTFEQMEQSK